MAGEVILQGTPGVQNLQVVKEGFLTLNVSAVPGGASDGVTHNLGYVPIVMATVIDANDPGENPRTLPDLVIQDASTIVAQTKMITVNESDVTFNIEVFSGSGYVGDWIIHYWLLRKAAA